MKFELNRNKKSDVKCGDLIVFHDEYDSPRMVVRTGGNYCLVMLCNGMQTIGGYKTKEDLLNDLSSDYDIIPSEDLILKRSK